MAKSKASTEKSSIAPIRVTSPRPGNIPDRPLVAPNGYGNPPPPEIDPEEIFSSPNRWFAKMFPTAVRQYGLGFLEGAQSTEFLGEKTLLLGLNEESWAKALGGEPELCMCVVYSSIEDEFYAYEYKLDAFCPVSVERLKLVLSHYLRRCAERCNCLVDVEPLLNEYRSDKILDRIISKAKIILEVEEGFIHQNEFRIYANGRYLESEATAAHESFVEDLLFAQPGAILTVPEMEEKFTEYCNRKNLPQIKPKKLKEHLFRLIREDFNLGVRNDIRAEDGRLTRGWKGIALRDMDFSSLHSKN